MSKRFPYQWHVVVDNWRPDSEPGRPLLLDVGRVAHRCPVGHQQLRQEGVLVQRPDGPHSDRLAGAAEVVQMDVSNDQIVVTDAAWHHPRGCADVSRTHDDVVQY